MITLTERAQAHVKNSLQKSAPGAVLRVKTPRKGCSGYSYEIAIDENTYTDDLKFEQTEGVVVCVDSKSYPLVKGLIIDFVTEGLTTKPVFMNPNAKGTCGCGESFSD